MEPLTTDRLLLRHATPADAGFFLELLNSPGWLEYIGDRKVYTEAAAAAYIEQRILPVYQLAGHGSFVTVVMETGDPVGFVGVFRRDSLPAPDFGFAFLAKAQRLGYAEEASRAILASPAVRTLPELLAITLPTNTRSQRLLERLGFRRDGEVEIDNKEMLRYRFPPQGGGAPVQ